MLSEALNIFVIGVLTWLIFASAIAMKFAGG